MSKLLTVLLSSLTLGLALPATAQVAPRDQRRDARTELLRDGRRRAAPPVVRERLELRRRARVDAGRAPRAGGGPGRLRQDVRRAEARRLVRELLRRRLQRGRVEGAGRPQRARRGGEIRGGRSFGRAKRDGAGARRGAARRPRQGLERERAQDAPRGGALRGGRGRARGRQAPAPRESDALQRRIETLGRRLDELRARLEASSQRGHEDTL